jgi:hypothetical protein
MRVLRFIVALAGAAVLPLMALLTGTVARAQEGTAQSTSQQPKVVLELFTSQGCSSCPAADALFHSYTTRSDVVAMSFAVDYWDYLGWKDTLASKRFTERQRAYAKTRGDGKIYTPQMVVNGLAHVNGAHEPDIERAILKTAGKLAGERVPVRVKISNGKLVIEADAAAEGDKPRDATIWLALMQHEVQVPVRGGENHGRTLTYYNIVRELRNVGTWTGKPVTVQFDKAAFAPLNADRCAVLLQSGTTGSIIGAAYLAEK